VSARSRKPHFGRSDATQHLFAAYLLPKHHRIADEAKLPYARGAVGRDRQRTYRTAMPAQLLLVLPRIYPPTTRSTPPTCATDQQTHERALPPPNLCGCRVLGCRLINPSPNGTPTFLTANLAPAALSDGRRLSRSSAVSYFRHDLRANLNSHLSYRLYCRCCEWPPSGQ